MNRDEAARLLDAYADGELDPAASLELEALLARDAGLRAACERIRAASAAIRAQADYHRAPAELAARLRVSIPAPPEGARAAGGLRRRRWLAPAAAFAAAAALTWTLAWTTLRPAAEERLAGDAVASHVRATLAGRLVDVESSDQHNVKPWLSARLPYSPPVSDFAAEGFALRGARVDVLDGHPVAVLGYQRRRHTIDVFVRPGAGRRSGGYERDGFNVERAAADGMEFWIVSDLNREELAQLARLLSARSPG
ncbi:MAG TPA: anti-sigma factor [Burkholderiales bacterium]